MAAALLRRLARSPLVKRVAAIVEHGDRSPPHVLRILTYHRVDRPDPFASHVEHLAANYRIVTIAQLLAALDGGAPLPRRSVLLTFDDGYRNFASVAWPLLRAKGLAATLFVPTAYPDGRMEAFWWDRLERSVRDTARRHPLRTPVGPLPMATPADRARAHSVLKAYVRELPHDETLAMTRAICSGLAVPAATHEVLGWSELRELSAQGVTIGAHSRTHPRLDRIPAAQARAEILESLADVEREIPGAPRTFAFPDGRHDDAMVEWLRSAGARLAFTTRRGINDLPRSDPLRLRRLNMDARDSLEYVRAKLASTSSVLNPTLWF